METLTEERVTSSAKRQVRDKLVRQGFIPIFVDDDLDSHLLVESAVEAGCTVLEYTCRRQDARTIIPWIKREFPHVAVAGASLVDGARASSFLSQTRPNFTTVDEMAELGVDGLVSFTRFRPETYSRYGRDLVMIPGVNSYNEALDELEKGADFIKLQGNTPWGADLVSSAVTPTHGLFPTLVTGGCSIETIPDFIRAGAVLVGTGFNVILKDEIEAGKAITRAAVISALRHMLSTVRQARSSYQLEFYQAVEKGGENPLAIGGWFS
ncbi:MAG: hypothetical protein ACREEM_36905 [Blastocatellia bacterium]